MKHVLTRRNVFARLLFSFFACMCLDALALLIAPQPEGHAWLEILEAKPDLILCDLRVSGGPASELIAIDPKVPAILWRVPSTNAHWRATSMGSNDVYTIEGPMLQRRRKSDGKVVGQRDLTRIDTPASTRRPWSELEQSLAQARRLLGSLQGNDREGLQKKMKRMAVDVEKSKAEWARAEADDKLFRPLSLGGGFSFGFIRGDASAIRVGRTRRWGHAMQYEFIFNEVISFDPASGVLLSSTEKTYRELAELKKTHRTTSYPHTLSVLDQYEIPIMEVESISHHIILLATDSSTHKEIWHLVFPVEVKRVRASDEVSTD